MTRLRDYLVIGFTASLFVLLGSFTVLFGQQALSMMSLVGKHFAGQAKAQDYVQLLTVCRSRDYEYCTDRAAERVLKQFPNNPLALGHLAVRAVRAKNYDRAASFFAAYFSQGGASAETHHWYSQLLLKQGGDEKALRWSYLAVLEEPENEEYSKALHSLLVKMNKSVEALTLIGFVTKGRPQGHSHWSTEIARHEQRLAEIEELMKKDLEVPIRGHEAYVPVVQTSERKFKFFKVVGRNCLDCPASMNLEEAKVVSRLDHNFLVVGSQ